MFRELPIIINPYYFTAYGIYSLYKIMNGFMVMGVPLVIKLQRSEGQPIIPSFIILGWLLRKRLNNIICLANRICISNSLSDICTPSLFVSVLYCGFCLSDINFLFYLVLYIRICLFVSLNVGILFIQHIVPIHNT